MMQTNKSKRPLRFGLIGCGRIAQTHLQALGEVDDCELVGIVDVRANVAKSVAEQFDCPSYDDHLKFLDAQQPDAVIICAPPREHAAIGNCFLKRQIHVLCEKPLALSTAEAEEMVSNAEANGALLMMASKFRYVDDVIKAKGIVESGILGDVILFENVFCSKVDMRNRWNARSEISGGGVLVDNGTHSVDIARFLLGPIVRVQAEEARRVQGLDVEDTARLFLRTESGTMGAVDLSWSIHKERDSYIELFGPEGVLSIGWRSSKFRQSEKLDWVTFGSGYDKLAAFTSQLKNFVGTIRGNELPMITAEGSLESVRVIEAAYRSLRVNKWIEVNSPETTGSSVQ